MVSAKSLLQHLFCVIVFVSLSCLAAAQTINFTATPASGCSPLPVFFTNTSTGFSNSATYSWDFGNGNTSALKDSVGAQYKDEHDYTVTLTIKDNGQTFTKSTTVTVYKKPVVNFLVDTPIGCSPLKVNFTSNSTPGDGTIASYFWDFGDGATVSGSSSIIEHIYTTPGTTSPSLTVTNSFGCYSTLKQPNLILVRPSVNPAFTASQTVLCQVNDAVSFINNSTGEGTLSYNWDFGDGATSTVKTPTHQYAQKGTYNVTLQVTNSEGCKADTVMPAYINVANYNADFEVPPVLCESTAVTFTDKSTPQPNHLLWIADNQRFPIDSSQFSFTFTAGQHTISLINNFGNCKDTAVKNITVLSKPATNGFAMNMQSSCGAPETIQFTDTTQGTVHWEWDVDNTTNGNFVPSDSAISTSYTYTADGTYYVWLRTTNAAGCTAETVQPITIQKVSADINSSAGQYGCDNLTTTFSATSSQVIKEALWDFDDGTTTTDKTPKHIFTKPGDYHVKLNYKTANGCEGVAHYDITVTPTPQFDFTAIPGTTICGSTPVSFDVTGSNLEGYYYWNYGDTPDYQPGTSTSSHQYYSDSTFTVSLVITKQGCSDTITKTNYLTVLPPFPNIYNQANTCEGTRGLVTFQDTTNKATEWSWNFGDGSPALIYNTRQPNVQHTYSKTGSYTVILTTKNGNCTVSDSIITHVLLRQSPVLTSSLTETCGSGDLPLMVANIETNPAAIYFDNNHDYEVDHAEYRDNSLFGGTYTSPDAIWRNSFHIDLTDLDNTKKDLRIITSSYYFNCLDTTNYIRVDINGPKAGFEVMGNNRCFKEPFTFSDTSQGSNGVAIIKREWDFGDGNTAAKIDDNAFDYQYQNPGTYNVLLTVTDKNGCTDTAQLNNFTASGPKAAFDISDNPVLPLANVTFYNQSVITDATTNNRFNWLFGDGTQLKNVFIDSLPVHNYTKIGVDTVMLIATNSTTKCADTAVQLLYVKNPNLDFTYTTEFVNPGSGCPPMLATFTNISVNTSRISWDFGDGTTAGNISLATHIYNKPGKYKVTLFGYFNDNTTDSIFQYITIRGPYATLKVDKQFVCGAQPIKLSAKASNAISYTWDFGDGTLTDAADTFAVHRYLTPGMYTPSLIVKDSNSCSFPFFLDKPVIIDTLHLSIHTIPAIVCDSSVVLFTPDVVSVAKDVVKVPLQYHWNFGTGNIKDTSNIETPAFMYNKTGIYPVIFSAASPYGCAEQTSADIVVNPTPIARIKGPSILCQNSLANFTGITDAQSSTTIWEWHFPNGNSSTEQNPAEQQFTEPAIDSVTLIVNNGGCLDTAYSLLTVNANPVIDIQPRLPLICAGQSVQLEAHDGISYKWLPAKSINDNTIANPVVKPDSTTLYNVKVTNREGCSSTDSVIVRVVQRFKVTTTPLLYLCRGSIAQLNASGADIYNWIEGTDISNTGIANPVTNTTIPQTYKVVGYDSAHCFTDTATTEIRIAELPTVKAGDNVTTFAGTPTTLTATTSTDVVNWNWLPGTYLNCTNCTLPVSTPQDNITYVVQVSNTYGCTARDSLQINVLCKQSLVQIPSAFTPNGDGVNERFNIRGSGIKEINRFAIFNRDGQMLFEKTNMSAGDANAGWDGTFGGKPMSPGTYVYIAEIVCATGEVYHYKGTVVLIR